MCVCVGGGGGSVWVVVVVCVGVGKSIVEHLLPTTYQKRWGASHVPLCLNFKGQVRSDSGEYVWNKIKRKKTINLFCPTF